MPMPFTTEPEVRAKFQLDDTVSADAINGAIADAHTQLLRYLDHKLVTDPPDDALVMGETLLAGAHVYRSLAAKEAVAQRRVTLGQARVEEGLRFDSLRELAGMVEDQAWYILAPYLRRAPARRFADATDTRPILTKE